MGGIPQIQTGRQFGIGINVRVTCNICRHASPNPFVRPGGCDLTGVGFVREGGGLTADIPRQEREGRKDPKVGFHNLEA